MSSLIMIFTFTVKQIVTIDVTVDASGSHINCYRSKFDNSIFDIFDENMGWLLTIPEPIQRIYVVEFCMVASPNHNAKFVKL